MGWFYENCKVVRVIDGDTVVLTLEKEFVQDIDFGFKIYDRMSLKKSATMNFRLYGINTPEVVGAEKPAGIQAKEALEKLLNSGMIKAETLSMDKYGRWLVKLWVVQLNEGVTNEVYVNDWLVENGFATVYMAG